MRTINCSSKNDRFHYSYEFPIGTIYIAQDKHGICDVSFGAFNDSSYLLEETDLILTAAKQLDEYFSGTRKVFNLPLSFYGTDFQKQVWSELQKIPFSSTRSYQEIAEAVGSPKACRAVGSANNKNRIAILVPCHRVIGKNGRLVGYAGGLHIKEFLLDLEQRHSSE